MALCCEGDHTTMEAAKKLGLSPETVKNHKSAIIQRLQVRSFASVCTLYGREQPFPTEHPSGAIRAKDV